MTAPAPSEPTRGTDDPDGDTGTAGPGLPHLAVTGSTGALGGRVARLLAGAGWEQRLLVRDAARAPSLPGAVPLVAAYADPGGAHHALRGVRTLLMVSASESADRLEQHRTFVDAAARAGVEHLVYTSFFGAAADCTFTLGRDHHATEEHIRASGMGWTFLRNNFYLDMWGLFADEAGVIRGPSGEGRFAGVARDDVARAAVAVLTDPSAHAGAAYDLTGPEALTLADVAAVLTELTGRPHSHLDESPSEAHASRASHGAPDWQVEAWVSTYTAIAGGELDGVTDDVERLTRRRPLTLQEALTGP